MNEENKIYCANGGCGAKLGPAVLSKILSKINQEKDDNLLVGFDSSDDAAVYKVAENLAIVQTLDFFPPMVDDPYVFGQIAVTNALSDIFAMGATFKTALNIVCYPQDEDINLLGKIIEGGYSKIKEAGGSLVGGHSINDSSIKYGVSANGVIDPKKILTNNSPKLGDCLILTKPLGVGIINATNNIGHCDTESYAQAIESMTCLNKLASEISCEFPVSACTDVTGFGLLVHLNEMISDTNLCAEVNSKKIPYIKKAYEYAENFYLTAAGQRNRNFVKNNVKFEIENFAMEELLFDPQTSGGLLFAINENSANEFVKELKKFYPYSSIIGCIKEKQLSNIVVI